MSLKRYTREKAIFRNPHISWNWDYRIIRQLGYKHKFRQNVVPPEETLVLVLS
jgi:hypothetical protein